MNPIDTWSDIEVHLPFFCSCFAGFDGLLDVIIDEAMSIHLCIRQTRIQKDIEFIQCDGSILPSIDKGLIVRRQFDIVLKSQFLRDNLIHPGSIVILISEFLGNLIADILVVAINLSGIDCLSIRIGDDQITILIDLCTRNTRTCISFITFFSGVTFGTSITFGAGISLIAFVTFLTLRNNTRSRSMRAGSKRRQGNRHQTQQSAS